jgi:hypothetical protein
MKFVGYAMVPMWVPHHPSPQAEPCTTLESFVHICCECSLIVQADYLILLILSEIQRVFSQFRDVAKVMIMQKKISPNFAIHQRWVHFKKKSFYILDYLWEIIIKMSGDLEMFSFKSGQFLAICSICSSVSIEVIFFRSKFGKKFPSDFFLFH